jgi:ATP-dependent Clp protease ATP-binding subunit ClpC
MWERFSESARKSVVYSQEEAARRGHGMVTPEHLLLGLLREPCEATEALRSCGTSPEDVRKLLESRMASIEGQAVRAKDMTLTARGKRVIDLAYDEVVALKHKSVGTEHLLLGVIREGSETAAGVFASVGIDPDSVRQAVRDLHVS